MASSIFEKVLCEHTVELKGDHQTFLRNLSFQNGNSYIKDLDGRSIYFRYNGKQVSMEKTDGFRLISFDRIIDLDWLDFFDAVELPDFRVITMRGDVERREGKNVVVLRGVYDRLRLLYRVLIGTALVGVPLAVLLSIVVLKASPLLGIFAVLLLVQALVDVVRLTIITSTEQRNRYVDLDVMKKELVRQLENAMRE